MKKYAIIFLLLTACGASKNTATPEQIEALENMAVNQHFEIVARWAQPLNTVATDRVLNRLVQPGSTSNRIDITGTVNYLRMKGDSVEVALPYFGERQAGSAYNNRGGISYEGIADKIEVSKDPKKESYIVKFRFRDETESFQLITRLFPGGTGYININSSHRLPIFYQGNVGPLE